MKFGVREICDVVLKAKAAQKVGNKIFYKNEPVIYFDTLKTSSMEGASTTVYAQGGRGNPRLVAWEGERTVTFTMEDALISPAGFMILSGAGLIDSEEKDIFVHTTEQLELTADNFASGKITLGAEACVHNAKEDWIYVMKIDGNGDVETEPFIFTVDAEGESDVCGKVIKPGTLRKEDRAYNEAVNEYDALAIGDIVLVDYYVKKSGKGAAQQIEISADKFGGNYYLEASTLFRQTNGVDMPAEFIIPNCKIQSNFNFTMAASGDPSSFTFTMDAFPDYTRFDRTKKVLAAIQMIGGTSSSDAVRPQTKTTDTIDDDGIITLIPEPGAAEDEEP